MNRFFYVCIKNEYEILWIRNKFNVLWFIIVFSFFNNGILEIVIGNKIINCLLFFDMYRKIIVYVFIYCKCMFDFVLVLIYIFI